VCEDSTATPPRRKTTPSSVAVAGIDRVGQDLRPETHNPATVKDSPNLVFYFCIFLFNYKLYFKSGLVNFIFH
jgi:hypothetical protein